MGRITLGAGNLHFNGTLFTTGWRNMQPDTSTFGTGADPTNLSLCKYMKYSVIPYVVGTSTGGAPSPLNYSINDFVRSKGYAYYFTLKNTTNNVIRVDNPGGSPYTSPGYPESTPSSWPGSGTTGVIQNNTQIISNTQSYIRVRATPSPSYSFSGWYTAPSGGSVITVSSDYNAYYNYDNVINNDIWYARNAAAPTYWNMTVGQGATASAACYGPTNTGYTIYFQGTGTSADFNTHAGPVYRNSAGTYQPTSYLHFVSKVRYWNNSTKNFGPQAFCPGV